MTQQKSFTELYHKNVITLHTFYIIFKHPVAARKNDVLFIFSLHATLSYINKNCVFYYITLHVLALSAIIGCC
jgi:hypothetical protein